VGRDVLRLAKEKANVDAAQAARLESLFKGAPVAGSNGKPGA
jgi:hypothetical protein